MKGAAPRAAREGFAHNEFFEALIRCREEQPRRYTREVSAGTRRQVELYEELKARNSAEVGARGKAAA